MDVIISGNESVLKMISSLHCEKLDECVWKPSVFNYVQLSNENYLIYNTLYNSLVRLTNSEYEKYLGNKKPGNVLLKKFIKNGIFVNANLDERINYHCWTKKQRKERKPYLSFNIATTLKCNARCAYCYEKGVKRTDFDLKKLPFLVHFIKAHFCENDQLRLNWFGGEPLLNEYVFDFVTDELSKKNIEYKSYIITNGSLITKKLVTKKFVKWNVEDVQITLDGLKQTYEKRKAYVNKDQGNFTKILKKIEIVANKKIRVHIRLNVDQTNTKEILQLLNVLEERFGEMPEVTWYPAFLTGVGNSLTEEEKVSFITDMFRTLHNPTKMSIAHRMYSLPKSRPCMRNDSRSFSVDVYGKVYACEHLVGRLEKSIGTLNSFDEKNNEKRSSLILRKKCKTCVFLPKCMGGCVSNLETGDEACMIEKYLIKGYLSYLAE